MLLWLTRSKPVNLSWIPGFVGFFTVCFFKPLVLSFLFLPNPFLWWRTTTSTRALKLLFRVMHPMVMLCVCNSEEKKNRFLWDLSALPCEQSRCDLIRNLIVNVFARSKSLPLDWQSYDVMQSTARRLSFAGFYRQKELATQLINRQASSLVKLF